MMERYRVHFNNSFQRAIAPDSYAFYKRFYENLVEADPAIRDMFKKTDMDRQIVMLIRAMTHIMSFSATLEADEEMELIAEAHGAGHLNIPAKFYDVWLECIIKTLEEFDPKFDKHIETSWRVMMAPGLEYMKSYCV